MTRRKRPLLSVEDRRRLKLMVRNAERHTAESAGGSNRAYARGIADALGWLTGEDMSRFMEEITR